MSLSNIIQEISKSGGWCEVSFHPKWAKIDRPLGRIAFYAKDFVVIQRFNIKGEFWDGFLIIHQEWVSKIKKANWIKRYLSVGGAVIENIHCPEILQKHTWYDTMESCRTSREPINLVSEE